MYLTYIVLPTSSVPKGFVARNPNQTATITSLFCYHDDEGHLTLDLLPTSIVGRDQHITHTQNYTYAHGLHAIFNCVCTQIVETRLNTELISLSLVFYHHF